jgi:hypothetical protein
MGQCGWQGKTGCEPRQGTLKVGLDGKNPKGGKTRREDQKGERPRIASTTPRIRK